MKQNYQNEQLEFRSILKFQLPRSTKLEMYAQFGIALNTRRKKKQLLAKLWHPESAHVSLDASAEVQIVYLDSWQFFDQTQPLNPRSFNNSFGRIKSNGPFRRRWKNGRPTVITTPVNQPPSSTKKISPSQARAHVFRSVSLFLSLKYKKGCLFCYDTQPLLASVVYHKGTCFTLIYDDDHQDVECGVNIPKPQRMMILGLIMTEPRNADSVPDLDTLFQLLDLGLGDSICRCS